MVASTDLGELNLSNLLHLLSIVLFSSALCFVYILVPFKHYKTMNLLARSRYRF